MVLMIGAGCFEKLLEVIGGLPRLVLKIVLSSGNKLLIGDANPSLVSSGAPLCTLVDCLGRCPLTAAWGRLPTALHENVPDFFLARVVPSSDVEELLRGLWLVTAELVHQGSIVFVGLERRDDVGIADLQEFVTLSGETPDEIPQGFPFFVQQPFRT
jgi:hypothetical protein